MRYPNITKGIFRLRPNRFIARVELDGQTVVSHVKNTGRCRELLVPGATVWLTRSDNPARKTLYDLVAVEKMTPDGPLLINMDSQAPNRVFAEWAGEGRFRPDLTLLRPESAYRNSRFDFYWESPGKSGFVEVKGVTLEDRGIARFPDAPTERGVRHLEELILAKKEGFEAAVCFIVQLSPMLQVEPNDSTHPAFGETLRRARREGVDVFALECSVKPGELKAERSIPVIL